jgi:hypothetical protein
MYSGYVMGPEYIETRGSRISHPHQSDLLCTIATLLQSPPHQGPRSLLLHGIVTCHYYINNRSPS